MTLQAIGDVVYYTVSGGYQGAVYGAAASRFASDRVSLWLGNVSYTILPAVGAATGTILGLARGVFVAYQGSK